MVRTPTRQPRQPRQLTADAPPRTFLFCCLLWMMHGLGLLGCAWLVAAPAVTGRGVDYGVDAPYLPIYGDRLTAGIVAAALGVLVVVLAVTLLNGRRWPRGVLVVLSIVLLVPELGATSRDAVWLLLPASSLLAIVLQFTRSSNTWLALVLATRGRQA